MNPIVKKTKNKNSEIKSIKNDPNNKGNLWGIFGGINKLLEIGITVHAGYLWGKYRNFDKVFDEDKYNKDRIDAENYIKSIFNINNFTQEDLQQLIDKLIDFQSHVIYLRRTYDTKADPSCDTFTDGDKNEAKKFIAWLFFNGIIEDCIEKSICPDFYLNLPPEIIESLQHLTVEEYCKINAYLSYLNRLENGIEGDEKSDYYNALAYLESAFINCRNEEYKCIKNLDHYDLILSCINNKFIKQHNTTFDTEIYLKEYKLILQKVIDKKQVTRDENHYLLSILCSHQNAKYINVIEYMIKCILISHIDAITYDKIRDEVKRTKKLNIKKETIPKEPQVRPFF